jgi:hypothetical protein
LKRIFLAMAIIPSIAFAQDAPTGSPYERALSQKIVVNLKEGLMQSAQIYALQDQLKTTQDQLKATQDQLKAAQAKAESAAKGVSEPKK